jgi:isoquinoline 1-oxidoreductase alpha subunit
LIAVSCRRRAFSTAFRIKVNGVDHAVDVDADTPLLWVLRDVLGMTGTKFGCGMALCGTCTVRIDGVATRSRITTNDGIGTSEISEPKKPNNQYAYALRS